MRCISPFVGAKAAFPCGQCMPCRLNRRRIWSHRILLEASQHDENAFVTVTYRDDCCPVSLDPVCLRNFIKRLRKAYVGATFRYYAVGEYGDRTGRPHYHLALFGYPPCSGSRQLGECTCNPCSTVRKAWGFGHVFVGILAPESAQYIAGYVVKKLQSGHPELRGRYPEFSRMSRNGIGGIGVGACPSVSSKLMQLRSMEVKLLDVPVALRHGSKKLPLGRYLRGKIREAVFGDKACPVPVDSEELRAVREYAFHVGKSVKSVYAELAGQARSYSSRGKI